MSLRFSFAEAARPHAASPASALITGMAVALTLAILLVLAPGALEHRYLASFIEEDGPLEVLSVMAWMGAAAYLVLPGRQSRFPAWSFSMFCFTMGMRENGLPSGLVPHGRRLIQWGFYLHGPESLGYRVVAGLVVLAVLVAAVHVVLFLAKELIQRRGWVEVDTGLFLLAMGLLVVAQLAESVQGHPGWSSALFPGDWDAKLSLESLEEGWEALGAVYVLAAVHLSRRLGRMRRRFG